MKSKQQLIKFIENENAFQVMGEFKRLGLLTKEDMSKAITMSRGEWLAFMKEKAGVDEPEN